MSNAVFPTLAGLTWNVLKSPRWSSKVQQSVGGKEMRAAYWTTPIYTWTLTYELLRASALLELQSLIGFFNARQGKFDSFLFSDPSDNNVTSHGFGVGDGVKTAFQLQRSSAGPRTLDFQGVQPFFSTPRTNFVTNSGRLDLSFSPRSGAFTANAGVSPDGSLTAALFTPSNNTSYAAHAAIGANVLARTFSLSVWLRVASGSKSVSFGMLINGDGGCGIGTSVTVTTTWQRFTLTGTGSVFSTAFYPDFQSNSDLKPFYIWGFQVEEAASSTPYISTGGSAGVAIPAYWPLSGDAFEPVLDLAPSPIVYRQDWQGNQQLFQTPRTNLCPNAEALNAGWSPRGSASVTADATVAPDGFTTADQFNPFASGGYIGQAILAGDFVGRTYSVSVWLRAVSGAAKNVTFGLLNAGDIGVGVFSTVAITEQWQRFTVTAAVAITTTNLIAYLAEATGNATGFYAWGFQVEEAPATTSYIKTTGAAVTRTDYTLSATGLVTLAVAPLAAAALTWTGFYYWRVRFNDDITEFNNFLSQLWEAKKVSLVSVKAA